LALPVFFVLAAALVVLLCGCGEKSEPTGARVRFYPVSVRDANGRLVAVKKKPRVIAVAEGAPARVATALGISASSVGTGDALDFGLIRGLHPDLVIAGRSTDSLSIARARALGLTVYVMSDRSLDGIEKALSDVGLLTGVPVRGRMARQQMSNVRARIRAAVADLKPVRVFFDRGDFSTYSDSSFVGSLIDAAGGVNVAGTDSQSGPVSAHSLRLMNPDVIIAPEGSGVTLKRLHGNPVLKWTSAVRNKRLVSVDMSLLEPGPDAVQGLADLAAALHPDAFR
jgi:ABC-type Fe3+-hydroxamate transport system substrate-binding protein